MENRTEYAQALMRYLDCPCQYFDPMLDDDPLMEAVEKAKTEGFFPVIVPVDETLLECLVMNGDPDCDGMDFDAEKVAAYRKRILESALPDWEDWISELQESQREDMEADGISWEEVFDNEDAEEPEANDRLCGYWDYDTEMTMPLILAKIPAKNPWEIFAWLPFGGWNECPDTLWQMAAAKHWYEKFGAVPAVVTHDVLEYILPEIPDPEDTHELALEQYAFCPDIVDQGVGSVKTLEDGLALSNVWYFWWD